MIKTIKKIIIILGIIGIALAASVGGPKLPDVALEKMQEKYNQSSEIQAKYQMKGASFVRKEIKNPELDKYKNEPKDEIEITLGEENETNFVPNIKIKRWNEVWFKIKPRITADIEDQELEFADNKIKFKTPEMEIEFEDFEDSYKMIWYLNSKPDSNVIEFDIESEGLDFFYQPELTQEEIDDGASKPENVMGSYAVYHSTKGRMNDINGKEYKVGKFGHIYRPKLIDSNGWETWGILKIENGIYSIEIPEDFYNNAVYPIRSNDTFGYETIGGTTDEVLGGGRMYGTTFTGAVGTLDSVTQYITQFSNYTPQILAGLYERTGVGAGDFVTNSNSEIWEVTASWDGWKTFNISGNGAITAVDYYILTWGEDTGVGSNYIGPYDAGSTNQTGLWAPGGFPTFPASVTSYGNRPWILSIYATYTPVAVEEATKVQIRSGKLKIDSGRAIID